MCCARVRTVEVNQSRRQTRRRNGFGTNRYIRLKEFRFCDRSAAEKGEGKLKGLELWIPFTESWGDIRNVTRADVVYFLLAAPIDAVQMFLLVGLLANADLSGLAITLK